MYKIKLKNFSIFLTSATYLVLILFIVFGSLSNPDKTVPFRTLSELIELNTINSSLYLIFVVVYGLIKFILIVLTTSDVNIILREMSNGIALNKANVYLFDTFTYFASFFTFIQLITMILLDFFPISQVYHTHVIVASTIFISSFLKSILLFSRRTIVFYPRFKTALALNVLYLVTFLSFIVWFYFVRDGLIEYGLIALIIAENVFLVYEYSEISIEIRFKVDDRFKYRRVRFEDNDDDDGEEDKVKIEIR